jgi:Ca2+-binding RTX toxin-like protein
MATINGTQNGENLNGTQDADLISGFGGFDNLFGNGGSDTLIGGAGEDYMEGRQGADTYDGTPGPGDAEADLDWDIVSYRDETGPQGVVVNLATGMGTDTFGNTETFIDIEDVRGSAGADRLIGSDGEEFLFGMAGNDTLDGGGGFDEIRYNNEQQYGATHGITLNFGTGVVTDGFGDTDTISNFESVRASLFADTLIGDDNDNRFRALGGNDTIDGGGGTDTVDYRRDANHGGSGGITANLSTGFIVDGYGATDTVSNVEIVIGTEATDAITGNSSFNTLRGEGGNDVLTGGGDDDDILGGAGFDTAVYSGSLSDYTITFHPDGYVIIDDKRAGGDGSDYVFDVEQFTFANATLQTSQLGNPYGLTLSSATVAENSGAGTVIGSLSGADPNGDTVSYSLIDNAGGRFAISGSNLVVANGELLDYEQGASHSVTVRMTDQAGNATQQTFVVALGDIASEKLTGTAGAEKYYGGRGNDRINTGSGNDWLGGGIGNDILTGGKGKDAFVFSTKPNKKTNFDKVIDFSVKDDSFYLDNAVFKKLGKGSEAAPGKLKAGFFTIGDKAKDKNDYLVYDNKKGVLYYDEDGSGGKAAVAFASLGKNLKMTLKDFFII